MSPLDFPDLLQERPSTKTTNKTTTKASMTTEETRGRKKSLTSGGSRLISTLRSRSRSRRSASVQPRRERSKSNAATKEEVKRRRSLSRPTRRSTSKELTVDDKYAIAKSTKRNSDTTTTTELEKSSKLKPFRKSRSVSPLKQRRSAKEPTKPQGTPTKQTKSKDGWGADIINLVDVKSDDDEDFLLNKLLRETSPDNSGKRDKGGKSNHHTKSTQESPKSVVRFPDTSKGTYSDDDDESSNVDSDEDDDDDLESEVNSVATNDLLEQVNCRMEQQRLMEEVKELRGVIEKKDAEIEQLTGQLRMAISTKCDLVIAHTELERLHERDLQERDHCVEDMKRSNLELLEMRAEVEKEFMNELTSLAKQVEESETRRVQEVQEKDQVIKLLEDKIRRMERNALQGSSARPDTDKVKFYKKKLGVYDDQ